MGDSQWSFSEEFTLPEFQEWMDALDVRGCNVMHGCVWLAIYDRGNISLFPNRDPKTDTSQPAFFQRLDAMVTHANARGIMMGLTIGGFPGNSNWWGKFNTQARDDRWFRYCAARYAAHNVRWVLSLCLSSATHTFSACCRREAAPRRPRLDRQLAKPIIEEVVSGNENPLATKRKTGNIADMKLTAVFVPCPEGGYAAFVEELPGANTQGETLNEARANLREAVPMVTEGYRLLAEEAVAGRGAHREELVLTPA